MAEKGARVWETPALLQLNHRPDPMTTPATAGAGTKVAEVRRPESEK